jgi:hypothetical protein
LVNHTKNTKTKQQANKIPTSNLQNFVAAQGSIAVIVNSTLMSPNNNKWKNVSQLEITIFCKSKKQKLDHHISTIEPPNIHFNNKKHKLESFENNENPKPKKIIKPNIYNGLTAPWALCGILKIIVVHIMLYLQFCFLSGMETLKDGKAI